MECITLGLVSTFNPSKKMIVSPIDTLVIQRPQLVFPLKFLVCGSCGDWGILSFGICDVAVICFLMLFMALLLPQNSHSSTGKKLVIQEMVRDG